MAASEDLAFADSSSSSSTSSSSSSTAMTAAAAAAAAVVPSSPIFSYSPSSSAAASLNVFTSPHVVPFPPAKTLPSPIRSNSDGHLMAYSGMSSSCPLPESPSPRPAAKEMPAFYQRKRWSSESSSDSSESSSSSTSTTASDPNCSPSKSDLMMKNSLWSRVGKQVSTVGKGLLQDRTAKVLLEEHWLEAADPKHRYGTLLRSYHAIWKETDSKENFFHWLDYGAGKELDLYSSPRAKLDSSGVVYLDSKERANCLVAVREGRLVYARSGELLHTYTPANQPEKFIFVVDPAGRFYVAKKVKGKFHHSSFLSGGTAKAAGNLTVMQGMLTRISRASGHYRPSEEDLLWFLELLRSRGVDISSVTIEDFV